MNLIKNFFVAIAGLLSAVYLLNPGLGVIELIPDNFPLIGNLDEATATVLLTSCLAYFGFDIRRLLGSKSPRPMLHSPTVDLGRESEGATRR